MRPIIAMLFVIAVAAPLAGAESRFSDAWGVKSDRYDQKLGDMVDDLSNIVNCSQTERLSVRQIAGSAPSNILWPDEQAEITVQVVNLGSEALKTKGRLRIVRYALYTLPSEADDAMFHVGMRKLANAGEVQVAVDIPAKGWVDLVLKPEIPATFGGYALILDLDGQESLFAASLVRTFRNPKPGPQTRLRMDLRDTTALLRLGAIPNRTGMAFRAPEDADYQEYWDAKTAELKSFQAAGLPIMIEFGHETPPQHPMQPLPGFRTHLREVEGKLVTTLKYPGDLAWQPSYDPAFKAWVKRIAIEYGWPKGPVNAMKLWNEPWEGGSIAGWAADMLRYREIFTVMCEAVEEARKEAGVQILLGGADSSSNTMDKHFPDNSDAFLKWTDFMSIHYQGMSPAAGIRRFVDRQGANGRVRVWDTESWCANSDERVAAILPSMYATGHDAAVGIHSMHVVSPATEVEVRTATGSESRRITQALPVGAAVGALQHFVGDRAFKRIVFRGLPLVYEFAGLPGADGKPAAEDGSLVVCADLAPVFGQGVAPFRSVKCLAELHEKQAIFARLTTLVPNSPERLAAEAQWRSRAPYLGARFLIADPGNRFRLHDCYGNALPAKGGMLEVPVDADGFYLRADGTAGAFAALLAAVGAGRLEGMQPVEVIVHDPTAPVAAKPVVRVELRNLLSRPITAKLTATMGGLQLDAPDSVALAPREEKTLELRIIGGAADPANCYPFSLTLDAGADGKALHDEVLRCNVIARRTIAIDGDLSDWKDVLPQTTAGDGVPSSNVQAAAWWPDRPFPSGTKKGLASVWLAYDAQGVYLAAKVADDTPHPGYFRMSNRDDDQFFYPEKVWEIDESDKLLKELTWPAGVRRYSYRGAASLPCGNCPDLDNLQIGFNALPDEAKPWYPAAPGTWKGFADFWSTDYEYALNQVAESSGGGTEVWRLRYPGMADKHFYPRQPKGPNEGVAQGGKLVVKCEGGLRLLECFLPWAEIPGVKASLDAKQPVAFSYRVNDDAGVGCLELARHRSASRRSLFAFKADWVEHWANEISFGWEP